MNPDYAGAHNNLGLTLKELRRLEEAEMSYREALALKPDFSEAHQNLGDLLMRMGKHEEGLNESVVGGGIISFDLKNGLSIE